MSKKLSYTVILEPQPEGGYTVLVPAIPGCVTEGDTRAEAYKNAREAIELHLECLAEDGQPIPRDIKPVTKIIPLNFPLHVAKSSFSKT